MATGCIAHMSRKEVADCEAELKLKSQAEGSSKSEELLGDGNKTSDQLTNKDQHSF